MSETSLTFKALEEVRRFLNAEGFQVSKSTIDRHKHEGKIRLEEGVYTEAAARKYARTFLAKKSSGKKVSAEAEDLQRQKLQADIEAKQEAARAMREKRERESGKYMLRSEAALDLAARAGALDNHLRHGIRTKVLDFIGLVNGNPHKAQDLRQSLEGWLDEALADYARQDVFAVEFEQPEEPGHCPGKDA